MTFKYYWEDFTPGRVFEHGSRTLTEAEIIRFASDWDPQRYHTDPRQAKDSPYGGIIASDAPRHPLPRLHPDTRASVLATARRLDPLVLRWAR